MKSRTLGARRSHNRAVREQDSGLEVPSIFQGPLSHFC
jgi:hypothetical protein